MKKGSIRLKLTLWFSLVLIAVVGIAEILLLTTSRKAVYGTNQENLEMSADLNLMSVHFNKAVSAGGKLIDYGFGTIHIDGSFQPIRNNVYTGLFSADGILVYGEDLLAVPQTEIIENKQEAVYPFTEDRTYTVEKDGIRYQVCDRITYGVVGKRIWLRSVISNEQSELQLRNLFRSSMYIVPLLIVLSILLSYFLAGRLLKPIQELETATEEISRGEDLKKRLDIGEQDNELGRLTGAFNRMLDRLENSFETERRFTSDASHELRTPTSVILTESEYMLERLRWPHEYREGFRTVKKQGERMNTLITDMLDFTRMEQGAERYPFEEVDLSALVKETADEMAKLKTRGIELHSDVQEGLKLNGNRELLSRMLTNLISNSYRYGMDNGFIRVGLEKKELTEEDVKDVLKGIVGNTEEKDTAVSGQADGAVGNGAETLQPAGPAAEQDAAIPAAGTAGEKIVLTVADNGIGIPEEDLPKIFDRFYRVDPSRTNPGSGLGLSMVKHIADMHHADVLVESEEGGGTVFRVVFRTAE
ncbi:MAG: HAMP domain-containing histidine kinase [Lachnospiraceae bacterium]|nr:HAMP domain-containing histidine kinase [Lachnospiraceae bacterium]